MTLLALLNGENVNWIQVNIIKQLNSTNYIVGDSTCVSVMSIPEDSGYEKHIDVGKGIKVVKPQKINDKLIICHPKFTPMKTKAQNITFDLSVIDALASAKIGKQYNNETTFSKIETE